MTSNKDDNFLCKDKTMANKVIREAGFYLLGTRISKKQSMPWHWALHPWTCGLTPAGWLIWGSTAPIIVGLTMVLGIAVLPGMILTIAVSGVLPVMGSAIKKAHKKIAKASGEASAKISAKVAQKMAEQREAADERAAMNNVARMSSHLRQAV